MNTTRTRVALTCAGLFAACGGKQNPSPVASETPMASATPATASPANALAPASANPSTPANYEVHEWGLLQIHADIQNGQPTEGLPMTVLAGPRQRSEDSPEPPHEELLLDKPVLYFHLLEETPITVDVAVGLAGTEVVEHYPPASGAAAQLRWARVHLRPEPCTSPHFPSAPVDVLPSGPVPEIYELVHYQTEDGACLVYSGIEYDHLFYRLAGEAPALPLDLGRTAGNRVRVRWTQAGVDMGAAFRVRRQNGSLFASEVIPFLGSQVELPRPNSSSHIESARGWFAQVAGAIGLSADEVRVFARAWDDELFGNAGEDQDSVVFFLPPDLVQAMFPLELTPAAARSVRVMALRIIL